MKSYNNYNLNKNERNNNSTPKWNIYKNTSQKFYTPPVYQNITYEFIIQKQLICNI